MAKRGQGEGSISKRPDGTWWARITIGKDENGKQKRRAFYGKTRKEVQEKLTAVLNDVNTNVYVDPTNMTVSQWLGVWLKEYKKNSIRVSSYTSYHDIARLHLIPVFGDYKLKDIRADMIQKLLNEKLEQGLSTSYIKQIYMVLSSALKQAVDSDLIASNAALKVKTPTVVRKKRRAFTADEQAKFIQEVRQSYYGDVYILGFATGMRIGEMLALTWDDIDFVNETVHINKTLVCRKSPDDLKRTTTVGPPKTKSSNRKIPLLPNIIKLLKVRKELQESLYGKLDLVFCTLKKLHISTETVKADFYRTIRQAEIEGVSLHSLRHTFATRCLENGVELRVVQEFLGHSSIDMTANLYTHVLPDKKKSSMMKLENTINID